MRVSKWGNSWPCACAPAVVEALSLKEGDQIEIHNCGISRVRGEPQPKPREGDCAPSPVTAAAASGLSL
jgi:antitoxin component of MazEF toxin-antitoxin module